VLAFTPDASASRVLLVPILVGHRKSSDGHIKSTMPWALTKRDYPLLCATSATPKLEKRLNQCSFVVPVLPVSRERSRTLPDQLGNRKRFPRLGWDEERRCVGPVHGNYE